MIALLVDSNEAASLLISSSQVNNDDDDEDIDVHLTILELIDGYFREMIVT